MLNEETRNKLTASSLSTNTDAILFIGVLYCRQQFRVKECRYAHLYDKKINEGI